MRPRFRTPVRPLALAALAACFGLAAAALPPRAERDLDDELVRTQLDQELVLAERTAVMLGELEGTLAYLRGKESVGR